MFRAIRRLLGFAAQHHFFGGLTIVVLVTMIVGVRMGDRRSFADGELHQDVMDRWGAPIEQPGPSVRYVTSGSVWNTLEPLPLEHQKVRVEATMNYRKRGLVYFSGFDFGFDAEYRVTNPRDRDIEIVFVFPLSAQKTQILLSDLKFHVDDVAAPIELSGDKLSWTGRMPAGASSSFRIHFRGRGLDSFVYKIDPALPVRNLDLEIKVVGGDNYDYPSAVIPASEVRAKEASVEVAWRYASLESGVPVGIVLPSEKSFDHIITTMLYRSWITFTLFAAAIGLIALYFGARLRAYEAYLLAAGYGFFFALLAYLAAFLDFYVAYAASLAVVGGLVFGYARMLIGAKATPYLLSALGSSMLVPTMAVILQGYTGLIYTLELLVLLALAMRLSAEPAVRAMLESNS